MTSPHFERITTYLECGYQEGDWVCVCTCDPHPTARLETTGELVLSHYFVKKPGVIGAPRVWSGVLQ